MNALAKYLAQDLDTRVDVRLVHAGLDGSGWRCEDEKGQVFVSQALVLTPPVPQSLALLDAGGVELMSDDRSALDRIGYAPCLCGLFWLDGQVRLPDPGAVQSPDSAISWIADNQRKRISPEATVVTVHAGPELSRQLFGASERETLAALQVGLKPYVDQKARIVEAQLKRWRYATPTELYPERCLVARGLPALVFAGDAFGEPRVEGAALSGLLAAWSIGRRLST
jgi:predicted NAD/FAD-dependent oxidoreductase